MTTFVRRQLPGNSISGFHVIGSSGGNVGHLQLFNPVASGVLVHLHFIAQSAAAGFPTPSLYFHDTALTTLTVSQRLVVDRRVSAAPVAELRSQLAGANIPPFTALVGAIGAAATNPTEVPRMQAELVDFVLLEGQGYLATPGIVTASVSAWWMWSEVPI